MQMILQKNDVIVMQVVQSQAEKLHWSFMFSYFFKLIRMNKGIN